MDKFLFRPVFWSRFFLLIGALFFLCLGVGIAVATNELSGFSVITIIFSTVLLCTIIASLGLRLEISNIGISQSGLFTGWECPAQQIVSWSLVRRSNDKGYGYIEIRSREKNYRLSKWIVSGNRRYHAILTALRTCYPSLES